MRERTKIDADRDVDHIRQSQLAGRQAADTHGGNWGRVSEEQLAREAGEWGGSGEGEGGEWVEGWMRGRMV